MNKATLVRLMLLLLVLAISGCTQGKNEPESVTDSETIARLDEAIRQTDAKSRFALTMKLDQSLTQSGSEDSEQYAMRSEGQVELEPLAVTQMIESGGDEEPSKLETILTPDGYYVYDHSFDEGWRQYPQDEISTLTETLSDYQVNPAAQLQRIRDTVGDRLTVSEQDGQRILTYEGGAEDSATSALMSDLLDSTLGGGQLPAEVLHSVEPETVQYRIVLDAESGLPVEIWSQSRFAIAFEPGSPMTIDQTFEVAYDRWDATEPVAVPEEAVDAPEIDMPSAEELQQWEEMERQLQEELDRLQQEDESGGGTTDGGGNEGAADGADDANH
ncbi:hypothetical protein PA598K_02930 [Paenibacillus sp. 598K]|uniref:DUF6612 family protein n=1 Tax=Paenibacillus sp. 598K TaxID=1117987 RepID=UPI000FFA27FB|nr:DUF6612 family protein [Paenibacillus sp. 598K]GBF74575.1 hypothetical protein PA598K_02930 [Paenibacillus sp. 598K]